MTDAEFQTMADKAGTPALRQALAAALAYRERIVAAIPPGECPDCRASDYLRTPWTFGDVVNSGLMPYAVMMGALVLLIVAVFVRALS